MKWMIFVVMAALPGQGDWDDIYIFQSPTFDTYEQCRDHVLDPKNIPHISRHIMSEYGIRLIHDVRCVTEDQVRTHIFRETRT